MNTTTALDRARHAIDDDEEFLTRVRAGEYGEPAQSWLNGLLTDELTADATPAEHADALIARSTEDAQHDQPASTHQTASCNDGTHRCNGWVAPLVYGVRECACRCHEQRGRVPWRNAYDRAHASFHGIERAEPDEGQDEPAPDHATS
ncbi:hypothetical protein [Amycolatopsis sp. NPDC051903]|uniref:hypothetical protein n=1 Tax=Amycolatopsis sp. NPDC051903 TaxID=3363936 RepID=UPI0037AD464E